MKLSITKSKNFISDCRRYEQAIKETKDLELESLYKRFISQAKSLDASTESIEVFSNVARQTEERNRLKSLRVDLEKKIMSLKEKLQRS